MGLSVLEVSKNNREFLTNDHSPFGLMNHPHIHNTVVSGGHSLEIWMLCAYEIRNNHSLLSDI